MASLAMQGQQNNGSYLAEGDLSAKQYTAVKKGTLDGQVVTYNGSGIPIGILQNAPEAGQTADVALPGGSAYLKVAAVLAGSVLVKADSNGEGVAATAIAGDRVLARIGPRASNTASGDIVPVQVLDWEHSTGA
jgi:hypothetical protein